MALWSSVAQAIAAATGHPYAIQQLAPLTSGRVSNAYLVSDGNTPYFVKVQSETLVRGYAWEARSLRSIAAAGVPTPAVIATGQHGTRSFLVLEYIEPAPPPSPRTIAEGLIRLHRNTAATFGADGPGWIGLDRLYRDTASTPGADGPGWVGFEVMDNTRSDCWVDFWCERRLRHRLAGCGATPAWDAARPRIEALLPVIRDGLATHRPTPVLLHGDLNTQNWMGRPDGSVLFIDPAIWYGDPEVDLAALAAGPPAGREAFAIYMRLSPRPAGHEWRIAVYRLWYLLLCRPVAAEPILTETLDRIARRPCV